MIAPGNSDGLVIRILKVERVPALSEHADRWPVIAAKWIVTTEVSNTSTSEKLLPAVPCYGATVNGKIDSRTFVGTSHGPVVSREESFLVLPPSGKTVAKQEVFAVSAEAKGQFTLWSMLMENVGVPENLKLNNFPAEWRLESTPVKGEFELSVFLVASELPHSDRVLGAEYSKLWRKGAIISQPVKLNLIAPKNPK